MIPTLKNNAAAGFPRPVKIELLKGAGILDYFFFFGGGGGYCKRKSLDFRSPEVGISATTLSTFDMTCIVLCFVNIQI